MEQSPRIVVLSGKNGSGNFSLAQPARPTPQLSRHPQVELSSERFGPLVRHAHLTASEEVLRSRYAQEGSDYGG